MGGKYVIGQYVECKPLSMMTLIKHVINNLLDNNVNWQFVINHEKKVS
jgi:hypothetical protein